LVNGLPKVNRIDSEKSDGTISDYVGVKNEAFHFAIYFDNKSTLNITGIGTVPYCSVYFRATSSSFSFQESASTIGVEPISGWSMRDKRKAGNGNYNFSALHVEPNPEPDEFDDKLFNLLTILEQNREAVAKLVVSCNGYVQVAMKFHNGNTALGGMHVIKTLLKGSML
jgi:hypothetical protein